MEDVQRQDEIELHPIQIEDRAFLDRDRNVGKLGYPAEEAGVLRVAFHRGDLEPQPRQAQGEEPPVRSYVERGARVGRHRGAHGLEPLRRPYRGDVRELRMHDRRVELALVPRRPGQDLLAKGMRHVLPGRIRVRGFVRETRQGHFRSPLAAVPGCNLSGRGGQDTAASY